MAKKHPTITQEFLKSILDYDPATGVFTWRRRSDVPKEFNTRYLGKTAGSVSWKQQYSRIQIQLHGQKFMAHRLAWLYTTGDWPADQIDHKDGDAQNNRFSNLRLATPSQNQANSHCTNTLGIKGVYKHHSKYESRITKDRKNYWLGTFYTTEEAHVAYMEAARELHGEFARSE